MSLFQILLQWYFPVFFKSALNFAPGGGDPDRERVPDAPQGQPLQGGAGQGQEAVRPTDIGYV